MTSGEISEIPDRASHTLLHEMVHEHITELIGFESDENCKRR